MTADGLALYAGVVLSLLFSYVPGLNTWFAGLEAIYKRLIMLGLLLLTAGVIYGIACLGWGGWFGLALTCDKKGLVELVQAFILAMIANQAAYQITPQTAAVRAVPVK
jgi:hypothetical protein